MSVLFLLIPLSLVMGAVALVFFSKGAHSGNFDVADEDWNRLLEIKEKNK